MKFKRWVGVIAALALLFALMIPAGAAGQTADLRCKPDGTFKIIQVADLQEFAFSSKITRDFLYELAKRERPDLFVLTGDNIHSSTADSLPGFIGRALIKSGIDGYMDVFDRIYEEFGARVTMVFGNHDNEAVKTITKAEEFAFYAAHKSFAGYYIDAADKGTSDEQGQHYGTHNLLIANSKATPVFNLWMFDSGSYDPRGGYSCVQKPQIDWFKQTNEATGKLPSLAFQHIPVPEAFDYLTPAKEGDPDTMSQDFVDGSGKAFTKTVSRVLPASASGELLGGFGPGMYNEGQYDALNDAGNVMALFWGHNHDNTVVLRRKDCMDLVNSPCTGFGSYGEARIRGARVIVLDEKKPDTYETCMVFYQGFYGDSWLYNTRVSLFNSMNSWANIFDLVFFRPLLWVMGLFA